jgi:hypothetical protein
VLAKGGKLKEELWRPIGAKILRNRLFISLAGFGPLPLQTHPALIEIPAAIATGMKSRGASGGIDQPYIVTVTFSGSIESKKTRPRLGLVNALQASELKGTRTGIAYNPYNVGADDVMSPYDTIFHILIRYEKTSPEVNTSVRLRTGGPLTEGAARRPLG